MRLEPERATVPERQGEHDYYYKHPGTPSSRIYRRTVGTRSEQLVVDIPAFSAATGYANVGRFRISPSGALVAFTVDTIGDESYAAYVRDINSGRVCRVPCSNVVGLAWVAEHLLVCTVRDELWRPAHVMVWNVFSAQQARSVYTENNDSCFLDVNRSTDGEYVLITGAEKNCTEIHVLCTADATQPTVKPYLLHGRSPEVQVYADHVNGCWYAATNHGTPDSLRVVRTSASVQRIPPVHTWETVVPPEDGVKLEDVDAFVHWLVLWQRVQGLPRVMLHNIQSSRPERCPVPLPSHALHVEPGANLDHRLQTVRLEYSSPVHPPVTADVDLNTRHPHPVHIAVIPGHDPDHYTIQRVHANSQDGTRVPLTIVSHRHHSGRGPCLLTGYGTYGVSVSLAYDGEDVALLQQGWSLAYAHVRGGGELGISWHHNARGVNKMRSFEDFFACAAYLVDTGITAPHMLAARGTSAGGLLVAATALLYPRTFAACLLRVPFVAPYAAMTDPAAPLTVHERDEWGDPLTDAGVSAVMQRYDPLINARQLARGVKRLYVTAALHDVRVPWWMPVALTQEVQRAGGDVLLSHAHTGHFDTTVDASACELAFLIDACKSSAAS